MDLREAAWSLNQFSFLKNFLYSTHKNPKGKIRGETKIKLFLMPPTDSLAPCRTVRRWPWWGQAYSDVRNGGGRGKWYTGLVVRWYCKQISLAFWIFATICGSPQYAGHHNMRVTTICGSPQYSGHHNMRVAKICGSPQYACHHNMRFTTICGSPQYILPRDPDLQPIDWAVSTLQNNTSTQQSGIGQGSRVRLLCQIEIPCHTYYGD